MTAGGRRSLSRRKCIPCRKGTPAMGAAEVRPLARLLPDWRVRRGKRLERTFRFPDFATALRFVNRAARIAEEEGHHPDLHLAWGRVRVEIWTHVAGGLTESDFILAAKIDGIDSRPRATSRRPASPRAPRGSPRRSRVVP